MKRKLLLVVVSILVLAAVVIGATYAGASPPPSLISYQGFVKVGGTPYDGTGHFKFALVSAPTGDGTIYWQTGPETLNVSRGLFDFILGSTTALPSAVLDNDQLYLRVWFSQAAGGPFQALEPNQRIGSVAYALRAEHALTADTATTATSATTAGNADTLDGKHAVDLGRIDQLVHDFTVAPGESITAGDVVSYLNGGVNQGLVFGNAIIYRPEHVFNAASTEKISAAVLSSDRFVVAYQDAGNSRYGTAVIGEVTGAVITFGSEYVFNSAATYEISVAALSSGKFVVAYMDAGNSNYGTAVIGQVAGAAITFGSECVFNAATTYFISASALSSGQFVVAYQDGGKSWNGMALIGQVAGTDINFGLVEYDFHAADTDYISVAALSSGQFVVAFRDSPSNRGMALIGQVAGTVITFGSEYVFNADATYGISVAGLSSGQFIVAYADEGNSDYGTAMIGEVTGTTITFGSKYVFNAGVTPLISVAALFSDQFVVVYRDNDHSNYGTAMIGQVAGAIITFSPEYVFNAAGIQNLSVAALSSGKFMAAYMDEGNSNYGTAVIGNIPGNIMVGIAAETHAAGQEIPIIISGVSDVHTGLTPGTVYYCDPSGSLTTVPNDYKVGLAISATEILLDLN